MKAYDRRARTPFNTNIDEKAFDRWWATLPGGPQGMKKAVAEARKNWARIWRTWPHLTCNMEETLTRAVAKQVKHGHFDGHDGKRYYPHGATWLSKKRWEDEVFEADPAPAEHQDPSAPAFDTRATERNRAVHRKADDEKVVRIVAWKGPTTAGQIGAEFFGIAAAKVHEAMTRRLEELEGRGLVEHYETTHRVMWRIPE